MSIFIKGMEMPKDCNECRFNVDGWCYVLRPESEEERKRITTNYCPLVEVQTPHGRLIDSETYAGEIRKRHKSASDWYSNATEDEILARAESAMITFTECFLTLKKMPTIIEAEGGE